jgi:crotonobetainyl-CoA:carnitine CoA-transferase CaiB-like acyl-CoA transferase
LRPVPSGRPAPAHSQCAPTLGEGTREVLQQLLQLPEAELQALQAKGVLTLPQA